MMEQPTTAKEDTNAEPKKSESPPVQDPNPIQIQLPHPNPAGELKPVVNANVINDKDNNSTTIDIDLNEGNNNNSNFEEDKSKSKKSVSWSQELVMESPVPREYDNSNPYVNHAPADTPNSSSSSFNFKETMGSVKDVLGRWGKKVGEASRKAEDLAGNTWQHLKTSPSLADAALGRIAQGTKVLAEGGYEKIFRQTFETVPEEKLKDSYACYLSTSAGPVMGVLYVSTEKLAFCSDNPLSYQAADKTEWSYYKVVIPLHQLKAVNPSTSRTNSAEKYIQVISVDSHEFWYMGFLNYVGAVQCLQEALQARDAQSV